MLLQAQLTLRWPQDPNVTAVNREVRLALRAIATMRTSLPEVCLAAAAGCLSRTAI